MFTILFAMYVCTFVVYDRDYSSLYSHRLRRKVNVDRLSLFLYLCEICAHCALPKNELELLELSKRVICLRIPCVSSFTNLLQKGVKMSDLKRARATGNFYRKAKKYAQAMMVPLNQDAEISTEGQSYHSFQLLDANHERQQLETEEELLETELPDLLPDKDCETVDYLFEEDDDDDVEARPIEGMSIIDGIRYWALSTNATYRSINMVLQLFKKANVKVPATAKTLLKTDRNRSTQIAEIGGGQFWYRGIKPCLLNYFRTEKSPSSQLSLIVSIDGLPLHSNGTMQFWPIMFSIHELPQASVMTAGIFCGQKKPESVEDFLRPMVNEMNDLMQRGIIIHGCHVAIKLRAIVADTPARAFILGVAGHTGYESCLKCTVVGTYSNERHTMTFPGINAPKRTDKSFRDKTYPGHHKMDTPLLNLKFFDIVNCVPTGDRLHSVDLGIGKRYVLGCRDGTLGKKRWTEEECLQMSAHIEKIKLPTEIHRKIRPIKQAHFWKGSESASFLHYAGFVVLKPYLADRQYKHYMLLFCAVTLFSSSVYRDKWRFAGELLNKFVVDFARVYGEQYISINVHILQHLYDEVELFGQLSSFSTYPFENQLQHLKNLLRSGWKELQQAINRLTEYEEYNTRNSCKTINPTISKRGNLHTLQLRKDIIIQNNERNCWYMSKDNSIYQFYTAIDDGNLRICGRKLIGKTLAFDYPFDSSIINAYKGCATNLETACEYICLDQVKCKLVAVPTNSIETIFTPLLHTLVE